MQLRFERATLALLALGAAVPMLEIGLTAQVQAATQAQFAPPREPLVLTRTVWRTLHDGQQIVVRRSYLLAFAPEDGGFRVSGQQIASEVEAPPALAAVARLERDRSDTSAFPLRLDAAGMILLAGAPHDSPARLDGENAARALIAGSTLSPANRREGETFLAAIAAKGGAVPWPVDLFNPREQSRIDRREVALPDGSTGTITMSFSAESAMTGGIPAKVSREVVSELGGTRRVSREEWTFAARVGP
jgi:hypothetical protein